MYCCTTVPLHRCCPAAQEELDAYDVYQRQLEDGLDTKTGELIALRRAAFEQASVFFLVSFVTE